MREIVLFFSFFLLVSFSFQAQTLDTLKVLDLEEAQVETENSGAYSGCPVKIASIEVSKLDRSASPSRFLATSSIPGVDMISAGGGVIRPVIRGLSGLRVITLYRGARIESQAWGEDHGVYLPEQSVARVEVIKGPSALAYGTEAIGGVINFVAETPEQIEGRKTGVSYRWFSNTNGYKASFYTKRTSEKAYHSFCGGRNQHGNYTRPDGEFVDNSYYDQFFAQGVFGYVKAWGLIDGAYSSSYNTAGIIGEEGAFQQSGDHLITTKATLVRWGWTLKPSVTYQLNHRIEYHHEDGVDEAELDLSLRTLRYDFKGIKAGNEFLTFILGSQGSMTSTTNADSLEFYYISDAERRDLGGYLITTLDKSWFDVKAAIRGDFRNVSWADQSRDFALGAASLGLNFTLSPSTSLNAISSLSNRAPSIAELTADGIHHRAYRYELGNPNLKAESSFNVEIGLSSRWEKANLDFNVYRNSIQNFIHYLPNGEQVDGYNVFEYVARNALLEGGELGMSYSEKKYGLTAKQAITYIRGTDLLSQTTLPFIPPFNIRTSLTYDKNDLFVSVGHMYTRNFDVLSVSLGYTFKDRWNVQLSGSNLLNEEYVPVMSLLRELNIPQPGRDLSVKISFDF